MPSSEDGKVHSSKNTLKIRAMACNTTVEKKTFSFHARQASHGQSIGKNRGTGVGLL